jgi:hypothetical protein
VPRGLRTDERGGFQSDLAREREIGIPARHLWSKCRAGAEVAATNLALYLSSADTRHSLSRLLKIFYVMLMSKKRTHVLV